MTKKKGLRGGWLTTEWTDRLMWGTFVIYCRDDVWITTFEPIDPNQPPVAHYIPGYER